MWRGNVEGKGGGESRCKDLGGQVGKGLGAADKGLGWAGEVEAGNINMLCGVPYTILLRCIVPRCW